MKYVVCPYTVQLLYLKHDALLFGGGNRGGSRISGKGVHMYRCAGYRFADFISFS